MIARSQLLTKQLAVFGTALWLVVPIGALAQSPGQIQTLPADQDRQNPVPAPGTQTHRQSPLPAEAQAKLPVVSKTIAKKISVNASGFDLSLRQASVGMSDWAQLVKSAGSNPERIAARIASVSPQTNFYWSGYVENGGSAILSAAVAHPVRVAGAGASASLNSGQNVSLRPSVDRTGFVIVKISNEATALADAPAGTVPRQVQQQHSYPVSLRSGVATALAQTTPIDATHVDVLILTATIDNAVK